MEIYLNTPPILYWKVKNKNVRQEREFQVDLYFSLVV